MKRYTNRVAAFTLVATICQLVGAFIAERSIPLGILVTFALGMTVGAGCMLIAINEKEER